MIRKKENKNITSSIIASYNFKKKKILIGFIIKNNLIFNGKLIYFLIVFYFLHSTIPIFFSFERFCIQVW
jgi:hypothetical protein